MIIAEGGVNHGGDMNLAREMIIQARDKGADLVKFQLYNAQEERENPYYELLKRCELSYDQAKMLFRYGESMGIEVFFSADNMERVKWCEDIGVKRYKVGAGHSNDETLLKVLKDIDKPTIISLNPPQTKAKYVPHEVYYLYCISKYPASISDYFNYSSHFYDGISDHTIGLGTARFALTKGAQIIEKHFTLDKSNSFPDHPWSMNPEELVELANFGKVMRECLTG